MGTILLRLRNGTNHLTLESNLPEAHGASNTPDKPADLPFVKPFVVTCDEYGRVVQAIEPWKSIRQQFTFLLDETGTVPDDDVQAG